MASKTVINASTGETRNVEMTPDEISAGTLTLQETKQAKRAELRTAWRKEINNGTVTYNDMTFNNSPEDQSRLSFDLAVALSAGDVINGYFVLDSGGNKVTLSFNDLKGFALAMATKSLADTNKFYDLKAAIASAQNRSAVNVISW